MHASGAEERLLENSHRARLRDQLAAWNRVSESSHYLAPNVLPVREQDEHGWSLATEPISNREIVRKLWHILPGFLILGVPVVRSFEPFHSHLCAVIVILTGTLSALSIIYSRCFTRPGERDWQTSVWAFAATGLLPLLAFPGHCELALTALVILSLGDGAAALGGQILHGPALPWNSRKTVVGMLSFLLFAAPAAAWVYWANSESGESLSVALNCAFVAAATAAVAESIPTSFNDNIRVGLAGTFSLVVTHWCLVG